MFLCIFLTFATCMFPINLTTVLMLYLPEFHRWPPMPMFVQSTYLVFYANSCCNPIILYFLGRKYRQAFQQILRCGRESKNALVRDENIPITCSGPPYTLVLIENKQREDDDAGNNLPKESSVEIEIIQEEVNDCNEDLISK